MKLIVSILMCLICLSGFGQEDDERLPLELEAEKKQQTEAAVKLNETQENIKSAVFNAPEELRKLGHNTIDVNALMDDKVVKVVQRMLAENPMQKMSSPEVRDIILQKIKGHPLEKFLLNNPRIIDFFVDIMKDERALSSGVGIFLRKDDLKLYGFIWLGLIIFSWIFKKVFFNKDWSGFKRFCLSVFVGLAVTMISLTVFYNMFEEELSPAAQIFIYHWKKA